MKTLAMLMILLCFVGCTTFNAERIDHLDENGVVYQTDLSIRYQHVFQNKAVKGQVLRLEDGSYEVTFDSGTKNDPTIQVLDRGIELGKSLSAIPVP